jgi:hypothetical protein
MQMPDFDNGQQQQQQQPPTREGQQPSQLQVSESDSFEINGQLLAWLLHWWVVLMVAWRACCYAAGPLHPMLLLGT